MFAVGIDNLRSAADRKYSRSPVVDPSYLECSEAFRFEPLHNVVPPMTSGDHERLSP